MSLFTIIKLCFVFQGFQIFNLICKYIEVLQMGNGDLHHFLDSAKMYTKAWQVLVD